MKRLLFVGVVAAILAITGIVSAATSWYFPEGSTQGKDFWMVVTNPNAATANVTFTFYLSASTETSSTTISANSRYTLHVNALASTIPALSDASMSVKVECTNGYKIFAERSMYWPISSDYQWTWGNSARGISGLEGCYFEIAQPSSFPITISQSGSYKLTSNITCTTEDVDAIDITTSDVTLDLNGFTISGPGESAGSSGNAVHLEGSADMFNIIIKNGSIEQFRTAGVATDSEAVLAIYGLIISDINFSNNEERGCILYYDGGCMIRDCTFYGNGGGISDIATGGVWVSWGSMVMNNVMYSNAGYGIYVSNGGNIINGNNVSSTSTGGTITESGIHVAGIKNRVEGNSCMYNNTSDINATANNFCINNSVDTAIVGGPQVVYDGDGAITDRNAQI